MNQNLLPEPAQAGELSRRVFLGGLVATGIGAGLITPNRAAATPAGSAANLLTNGGFDEVVEGLPRAWRAFAPASLPHVSSSQLRVRSEGWSLRLADPDSFSVVGMRSEPVPVTEGGVYDAMAHVYLERGEASLYLEFWDASGQRVWNEFRTAAISGSWQQLDVRGVAPAGAIEATVLVYTAKGNVGVGYFDDASLVAATPLTPEFFGPASLTAAVRGAVLIGDEVVISSRYKTTDGRLRLARVDARSGAVLAVHDLDVEGSGGHRLASDGRYLYIGPSGSAWIWRFDPTSGSVSRWVRVGASSTWYYTLLVDGDHLYLTTYPDCMVRRVRLSDGLIETYGRVSSSLYATTVVVDDEFVYGGSAAPGTLLRWPKAGGPGVDLSSFLTSSPVGILAMIAASGMIHVACGREVISMNPDGSGRVARSIPEADRYVDQLTADEQGRVFGVARLTSAVYRIDADVLVPLGRPLDNVENQLLAVAPDGGLVGVSGLGHVWRIVDGDTSVWDTALTGFGYPEVAQTMLLTARQRIWVGGHFAMTVHHPPSGTSRRFAVNGEPKAMVEGPDGTVYAGMYPTGEIIAIDPVTTTVTLVGTIGNGQMRTRAMHMDADRRQLLVASGPTGGNHTGALSFINPRTGEFEVRKDLLPDQSVMTIAVAGATAYIAGDTYGESTGGPRRAAAQVAAVDLNTRSLIWSEELRPDWQSYETIHVVEGVLFLMARRPRGRWFAMDLASGNTLAEGDLGGYGAFGSSRGRIFSWVHWTNDIRQLPLGDQRAGKLLHTGVPNGWYNSPLFNITPDGASTWGMHATHLARFPLRA
ncbi:hypothetical protein [Microbacterium sp. ABRD28]|uniref:YncE family protein n=1 Tax=Microbacterium sp. ABRD28 TaxID=2268461 RepID=UPI000F54D40A|nr:hypothetical protein [Microbacterium sp. ABRD28]AZC14015.1 hypothetical protein DT073_10080 [Microbacterium sp. ABRD28]